MSDPAMQRGWAAPPGEVSNLLVQPTPGRRWWLWGLGVVAVLLSLLIVGGFKLYRMFQGAGRPEITRLHSQMVRQDYAGIFAEADPKYQEQVGEERSDALFKHMHEMLGDPVSYSVTYVSTATNSTDGTTKVLDLSSRYSKGPVAEKLTFHKVGGKWLLYQVTWRSHLLDSLKEREAVSF